MHVTLCTETTTTKNYQKHMNENEIEFYKNAKPLPRYDLREPAFRRYERYIARACEQDMLVIDVSKDRVTAGERIITARSFCLRFRDAVMGYLRYHYKSDMIPPGYPVNLLKCMEVGQFHVRIENRGRSQFLANRMLNASDKAAVEALCKRITDESAAAVERKEIVERKEHLVVWNTVEERDWLASLDKDERFYIDCRPVANTNQFTIAHV